MIEDDPALIERLRDPNYSGQAERAILFTIEAWDANCPQHIHPRFSQRQITPIIEQLQLRVSELEAELAATRNAADKTAARPSTG